MSAKSTVSEDGAEEKKEEKKDAKKDDKKEEKKDGDGKDAAKKEAAPALEKKKAPRKVEMEDLVPENHWKTNWPEGVIDNGDNDDRVLKLLKPKEEEKKDDSKPVKFMNVRPALEGQWPYKTIDDGTDDDSVIDVGIKADNMAFM